VGRVLAVTAGASAVRGGRAVLVAMVALVARQAEEATMAMA